MQIIDDKGVTRTLEQYEIDALEAAREEYYAGQGVTLQYDEDKAKRILLESLANVAPIPVTDAVRMVDVFPQWESGQSYEAGYKVRYAGYLWKCLQAHDSLDNWTPTEAPSLWAKVLVNGEGEEGAPEWQQPDSTNPYNKGDRVTFEGKVYVSLIDSNTWSPSAYPEGWQEVE